MKTCAHHNIKTAAGKTVTRQLKVQNFILTRRERYDVQIKKNQKETDCQLRENRETTDHNKEVSHSAVNKSCLILKHLST